MDFALPVMDPNSPVPLYHQLFSDLRARIQSGDIAKGHKLPSEKFFAEHLSISRITVKRAINELAAAGLVTRQRGAGTTVTLNTAVAVEGGLDNMLRTVVRMRENTRGHLLARNIDTLPSKAQANLKLAAKTPIETIIYTLSLNDAPFSYVSAALPAEISKNFSDRDIECKALLSLLQSRDIYIVRAEQTLSAIVATQDHARALDIEVGAPLLEIQCVMFDETGRPVQDITSCFPPEIYKYQMTLTDALDFTSV